MGGSGAWPSIFTEQQNRWARRENEGGGGLLAASVRWVLLRTHGAPSALLRSELQLCSREITMGLKQDLREVYKVNVHPFLLRADSCVTNFRVERHLWIHFQFVGRTPAFLNASLFEENGCSLLCVS